MTQPVAVPDPVYEAISKEAEQQDLPRGAIVKQWMEDAERNVGNEGIGDCPECKYGRLRPRRIPGGGVKDIVCVDCGYVNDNMVDD